MISINEFFIVLDEIAKQKWGEDLDYSCKRAMYCIYQMATSEDTLINGNLRGISMSATAFSNKSGMSKRIAYNSLKALIDKKILKAEDYKREFTPLKDGGYSKNKGQTYWIDISLFSEEKIEQILKKEKGNIKKENENMIGNIFNSEEKEYLNRNAIGRNKDAVLNMLQIHLGIINDENKSDYMDLSLKLKTISEDDWDILQNLLPFESISSEGLEEYLDIPHGE